MSLNLAAVNVQKLGPHRVHSRAWLSGGLGIFASLLAIAWGRWGYNLPSAVNVTSLQSQNLMLLQIALAFAALLGSGLMLARYTAAGGIINVLVSMGTFLIGVYFASDIANAATSNDLAALPLRFSDYYKNTVNIPTDRVVSTFVLVPILPIALLLLISGLGALSTYRSSRKLVP